MSNSSAVFGMSLEAAMSGMFPVSGDAMRIQEVEDSLQEAEEQVEEAGAAAYEEELERDLAKREFLIKIEGTYGSIIREML